MMHASLEMHVKGFLA